MLKLAEDIEFGDLSIEVEVLTENSLEFLYLGSGQRGR
jgi:hypothetical protein